MCCFWESNIRFKNRNRLKVKQCTNTFHENGDEEIKGSCNYTCTKNNNNKTLEIKFDRKEGHHIMIKESANQKHIIVLMQLYALKNTTLKCRSKY